MGSRGASTNAISGVDIALRDIRGKMLGEPIYKLLAARFATPSSCTHTPTPTSALIRPDRKRRKSLSPVTRR
jgi:L-alanine-DL-glutamate epimerase-like enolase superfamily enzyme